MTARTLLNRYADRLIEDFDALVLGEYEPELGSVINGFFRNFVDISEASIARLDGKAGATLTHISMMIAAATFVISSDSSSVPEKSIILVEVTLYLFAALCCLRCLVFTDRLLMGDLTKLNLTDSAMDEYGHKLVLEVLKRGRLTNLAVKLTFFVTFIFALSLAAHIML